MLWVSEVSTWEIGRMWNYQILTLEIRWKSIKGANNFSCSISNFPSIIFKEHVQTSLFQEENFYSDKLEREFFMKKYSFIVCCKIFTKWFLSALLNLMLLHIRNWYSWDHRICFIRMHSGVWAFPSKVKNWKTFKCYWKYVTQKIIHPTMETHLITHNRGNVILSHKKCASNL